MSSSERDEAYGRLGGVFDLTTPQGRAGYEFLLKVDPWELELDPQRAEETLRNLGVGSLYTDTSQTETIGAKVQIGLLKLLSVSNSKRSTEGILYRRTGGEGQLFEEVEIGEREYRQQRDGLLPKLLVGEERTSTVSVGSIDPAGDNNEQLHAALVLDVKEPHISKVEHAELTRLARAFGQTLPRAKKPGTAGRLVAEVTLDEKQLQRLCDASSSHIRLAFTHALSELEGTLAPWANDELAKSDPDDPAEPLKTVKQQFLDAFAGWQGLTGSTAVNARDEWAKRYLSTTGRNLERDAMSYQAMHELADALDAKSKRAEEWESTFSAIGRMTSRDLRTTLVALHRLGGSDLAHLLIDAGGVRLDVRPHGAAPIQKSRDHVGRLMSSDEVDFSPEL